MVNIGILGSCVTRDMMQFFPKEANIALYVARTSFASLVSEATPIELNEICLDKPFNCRVVYLDLTKGFWQLLERSKPDVMLFDFIDERFDLLRKDNQIVTRSNYLTMSGVDKRQVSGFELLRRSDPKTFDLWKGACKEVIARIKHICPNFILHRALWAEKYYIDDRVVDFDDRSREEAVLANAWLNEYYDFFMSQSPATKELRVPAELCVSNFAHKWGRDFFHYGDAYYMKLADMVASVL